MDASMTRTPFCRLLHFFGGREGCREQGERVPHASLMLVVPLDGGNQLRTDAMDLTLKDDATKTFSVELKDKFGAVAQASGPLTVVSSDETIVLGTLSADGQSVTVAPAGAGKLGAATVTVSDEADSLSAVVNVTVVAGSPASIELTDTTASTEASSTASTETASTATADSSAAASSTATDTASTDAASSTSDAAASTDASAAPAADAASSADTAAVAS
jgi:hypothetical protein